MGPFFFVLRVDVSLYFKGCWISSTILRESNIFKMPYHSWVRTLSDFLFRIRGVYFSFFQGMLHYQHSTGGSNIFKMPYHSWVRTLSCLCRFQKRSIQHPPLAKTKWRSSKFVFSVCNVFWKHLVIMKRNKKLMALLTHTHRQKRARAHMHTGANPTDSSYAVQRRIHAKW